MKPPLMIAAVVSVFASATLAQEEQLSVLFTNVQVFDGGGRTLVPGIVESHGHLMVSVDATSWFNTHDFFYIGAAAAMEAENHLMRGCSTVRDIGGPVEGAHRAIEDERIVRQSAGHSGEVLFRSKSWLGDGVSSSIDPLDADFLEVARRGSVAINSND